MALGSLPVFYKLKREFKFNIIDAHFAYPDGYAATLLGLSFKVPVAITLRGTEVPLSKMPERKKRMLTALKRAACVFSVADSLKQHMASIGADPGKILVVGNGVDSEKFYPLEKAAARKSLAIPSDARVLVSVGGLVERKGFHRFLEVLPESSIKLSEPVLSDCWRRWAGRGYEAAIGTAGESLGIEDNVRFLGACRQSSLKSHFLPQMCSCWLRLMKAGRTFFWRRWHAGCRLSPRTSAVIRKWSVTKLYGRSFHSASRLLCSKRS